MIGDEQKRAFVRYLFKMLKTINAHQVIRRKPNPSRAERALAERPEIFRAPAIHPRDEAKRAPLKRRQRIKFIRLRLAQIIRRLNLCGVCRLRNC